MIGASGRGPALRGPGTVSVRNDLALGQLAKVLVGLVCWGVSAAPASPGAPLCAPTQAYIVNQGSETVSVVDLATLAVVATIPVNGKPAGVAISPGGGKVYVTAPDAHDVAVIDTTLGAVIARFAVGGGPLGIAVHPVSGAIYVADWYSKALHVIDPLTGAVLANLEAGQSPSGIALTSNGARALTADREDNTVSVFDTATNLRIAQIAVGQRPFGVTIDPSGDIAYTANVGSNDVSVIDLAALRVIATVPVGRRPYAVAVSTHNVFVTDQYGGTVTVFQRDNRAVVATIPACDHPEGINYDWTTGQIYVACWFDNELIRIDATALKITGRVKVGDGPRAFGDFLR